LKITFFVALLDKHTGGLYSLLLHYFKVRHERKNILDHTL
jgi:hypothetical protein